MSANGSLTDRRLRGLARPEADCLQPAQSLPFGTQPHQIPTARTQPTPPTQRQSDRRERFDHRDLAGNDQLVTGQDQRVGHRAGEGLAPPHITPRHLTGALSDAPLSGGTGMR